MFHKPRLPYYIWLLVAGLSISSANELSSSKAVETPDTKNGTSSTPTMVSTSLGPSADSTATCRSKTVNYITHRLPQQCLRSDRISFSSSGKDSQSVSDTTTAIAPSQSSSHLRNSSGETVQSTNTISHTSISADGVNKTPAEGRDATVIEYSTSTSTSTAIVSVSTTVPESPEQEADIDSPLDTANFLSFEEWKKQNLAKVGQNPDHVGQVHHVPGERKRPGISNALDTLGEESEIELDFSGFGGGALQPDSPPNSFSKPSTGAESEAADRPAASPVHRSKDAGKTCKERTNYASFDCAATVLKSNSECKSASSVLVENKDSYMLNQCSAKNKFFIVELCNDILIDTIVLANYEFFSSIFRHFRVSVSDRYPVKMEKWKTLGTFEARNTREVQAFLIEHPQIWARYMRIEFLSHYGNEYYCPLSLVRVHGTTMMEQFRQEEELSRGETGDSEEEFESEVRVPVAPVDLEPVVTLVVADFSTQETTFESDMDLASSTTLDSTLATSSFTYSSSTLSPSDGSNSSHTSSFAESTSSTSIVLTDSLSRENESQKSSETTKITSKVGIQGSSIEKEEPSSQMSSKISSIESRSTSSGPSSSTKLHASSDSSSVSPPISKSTNASTSQSSSSTPTVASSEIFVNKPLSSTNSTRASVASSTTSSPQAPQPSTQESFFNSIHKRLKQLESNSTLSLQYIEEQSRILRDAFSKVEKRQVTTTSKFLSNLNSTVLAELQGFRQAYDQLWQSTVIELDEQKEQYQREMLAMSARLSIVADELVWQKRMAIVQSTLVIICLGFVLFARPTTISGATLDMPLLQQMVQRSHAAALKYSGYESEPASPPTPGETTIRRPGSGGKSPIGLFRRRLWKKPALSSRGGSSTPSSGTGKQAEGASPVDYDVDAQAALGTGAPEVLFEPPTPPNGEILSSDGGPNDDSHIEDDELGSGQEDIVVAQTQSSPATPNGTRDGYRLTAMVDDVKPSWSGSDGGDSAVDDIMIS